LTIAERLGIPGRECSLGRQDLFAADEVFLTGSGARIVPVARFDGVEIGASGWGPLTRRLSEAFSEFVVDHSTPIA
ncbi:MAG: branched-chain amino acid aminotransferase, partial [Myxococcota bacterium]